MHLFQPGAPAEIPKVNRRNAERNADIGQLIFPGKSICPDFGHRSRDTDRAETAASVKSGSSDAGYSAFDRGPENLVAIAGPGNTGLGFHLSHLTGTAEYKFAVIIKMPLDTVSEGAAGNLAPGRIRGGGCGQKARQQAGTEQSTEHTDQEASHIDSRAGAAPAWTAMKVRR